MIASVFKRQFAAVSLFCAAGVLSALAVETPFSSYVNWDYHHRKPIEGARYTALVIRETLKQWNCGPTMAGQIENGDAEAFVGWLRGLPRGGLVYMASHQSPAADWDFTQNKLVSLANLLPRNLPADPSRVVILDACYAETARRVPGWQNFAPTGLMAGEEGEETFQLEMFMRRPVDFETRYPAEYDWLKTHLPSAWNGKITFLGLLWTKAFLSTPEMPQNRDAWAAFFGKITEAASEFREKRSSKLASTPIFYCAPSGGSP